MLLLPLQEVEAEYCEENTQLIWLYEYLGIQVFKLPRDWTRYDLIQS